ncbi:MAG: hypothetical protein KAJ23_01635 [Maribacter sp.]|nr:hypothetical protein [Maribacter sp.]
MNAFSQRRIEITKKGEEKSEYSTDYLISSIKCSFSGKPADYHIGLSSKTKAKAESIRIVGSVCSEMVEIAINKLLSQELSGSQWPVVLDLDKKLLYHTYDADEQGLSAILGWKEYNSKVYQ